MVVRKLWVPSLDSRNTSAPLNSLRGQAYSLETGSDPFFPRGEVRADADEIRDPGATIDLRQPRRQSTRDEVDEHERAVQVDELEDGLRNLALCAGLCNQATLNRPRDDDQGWEANGDPTEIALQVAAHKLGHGKPFLTHAKHPLNRVTSAASRHSRPPVAGQQGHYEQLVEHPFDSSVKRMSIAYCFTPDGSEAGSEAHVLCLLKGAVERVIEKCSRIHNEPLSEAHKCNILRKVDALAAQGLRVLALCGKRLPSSTAESIASIPRDEFENDFTFLGLAGIFDPPRKESAGAVADCLRAGITPRMLTGDHPSTATAIALSIGILDRAYGKTDVMTGQQFDALSDAEIDAMEHLPLVVARCAPETKVRMVDAIHRRGQHTVMTGDGVNDSPALKRADVGVGMGTGSDVAKQSSNLVLADDNFATICRAIRKGRSVFKNLAKFLLVSIPSMTQLTSEYLLSGNLAEVIVLLIGLAFKDDNGQSVFPLSPVAALWINTLAAGPPALALGLEPTAADAMDLPPTAFHKIFTLEFYLDLIFYGFLMGALRSVHPARRVLIRSLVNFVIVLWGYFPGDLGTFCNEVDNAQCDPVFQARGTCFATLVIIL